MKTTQKSLVFVVICGILLHFGVIFWFHGHPISGGFHKWNQADFVGSRLLDRIKRNRQLSEIFANTVETPAPAQVELEPPKPKPLATPDFVMSNDEELDFLRSSHDFFTPDIELVDIWANQPPVFDTDTTSMALMTIAPPQLDLAPSSQERDELKDVSVSVQYAPRRFHPGYVFKLTLTPKTEARFTPLPQHFVFVLDRSHAIPRLRYYHNRKALSEALDLLGPEDTFNLFVCDHRVTRFSDVPLVPNAESVAAAREFLERQPHGGVLAASELYASLGKIIAHDAQEERITTIVLLSDGATYMSSDKERETMRRFMQRHQGKVVLYPVVSGNASQQPMIDLLSAFNGGKTIYAGNHGEIGERVADLVKAIKLPVGREVVATALSEDPQMTIQLQPERRRLPLLYRKRPFVLWGTTNRLGEFTLFLQGEDAAAPFDIKKTITFQEAHGGTLSLERQWTQQLSQTYYQMYFEDGNLGHLESAKKLLIPLNLPVPFP